MANKKQVSERDKQVEIRNSILYVCYRGCEDLNKGDRSLLSNYLKCLHKDSIEFVVELDTPHTYEFFNDDYTAKDGLIIIKEREKNGQFKELVAILQLKSGQCKDEWRAYELNPDYFRYDEDLEAEAQWEQDSETAYERYLDSKASFDD